MPQGPLPEDGDGLVRSRGLRDRLALGAELPDSDLSEPSEDPWRVLGELSPSQAELLVRHPEGFEVFAELVGDGTPEAIEAALTTLRGTMPSWLKEHNWWLHGDRGEADEEAWWRSGAAIPLSLVLAQYYREQLIENVRMGMEQAARKGRWLNRAPTGYDMVNWELVPNEVAPLVGRIFALRACGASYPAIEREVGICYSTVRQIVHNRVYLGEVRLRDQWFPGNHPAPVTRENFDAAHRGHVPGRRRGRDVLHGRVRCGLCGRRIGPDTNERGQMLYRCWHRGKGCKQPGRSTNGLQRAAVLGLQELASNKDLQEAIREELGRHVRQEASAIGPIRQASITALMTKRNKLLQLHYDDRITAEAFSQEEARLTAQIESLRSEEAQIEAERMLRDDLATRYSEVEELLAQIDIEVAWEAATPSERRVLIEELVEAVVVFPDHLEVQVAGAPPLNVTLAEVGLRVGGTESVVSEGGLEPPRPFGH